MESDMTPLSQSLGELANFDTNVNLGGEKCVFYANNLNGRLE